MKKIDLSERGIEIDVLNLHEDWRLINIQEITDTMSAILIENKKDFSLRFMRCFF